MSIGAVRLDRSAPGARVVVSITPPQEGTVYRRRMLAALALVGLPTLAGGRPVLATAVRVVAGVRGQDDPDDPDDPDEACERVTTTGRAVVRRRCDGTRSEAHVDNRITVTDPRSAPKEHERPIDRLRSRGDGRIQATGDKGARRELREQARRGN